MPKRKKNRLQVKKRFLRPIHIQALIFLAVYFVASKFVFFGSVASSNIYISFFGPFIWGALTSAMFLYLFSHEDFFHFIKVIEKKEEKQENKLLKRFKHFGKIFAVMAIAVIGGTIVAALAARFLLSHNKYKYPILVGAMFLSTVFSVSAAKGLLSFIF